MSGTEKTFASNENTSSSSSSSSSSSIVGLANNTFAGASNLLKLLPTGTVIIFQILAPLLSNNGNCHPGNKYATGALLVLSAIACAFACFTDSFTVSDGRTYYGIATCKAMYVFGFSTSVNLSSYHLLVGSSSSSSSSVNLSSYRLRFGDFIHAAFSVLVFAVITLLNPNTVDCYYPSLQAKQKALIMALPPVVGAHASFIFMFFPNKRHGIGHSQVTSRD